MNKAITIGIPLTIVVSVILLIIVFGYYSESVTPIKTPESGDIDEISESEIPQGKNLTIDLIEDFQISGD